MRSNVDTKKELLIIKKLDSLERVIAGEVRQFVAAFSHQDSDDLEQICKMVLLGELSDEDKLDSEKYTDGFWRIVVRRSLQNSLKAEQAQKRRPEKPLQSLDAPLSGDDQRSRHDLVGKEADYELTSEKVMTVIDSLKAKLGGKYIKALQAEKRAKEKVRVIFRGVIEDICGMTATEAVETVNYDWFVQHGLGPLLWAFYRNSPYDAIMDTFRDDIENPYAMRMPQGYWRGKGAHNRARESVIWLLKKKNVVREDDCTVVGSSDFEANGLGRMLQVFYRDSPYLALKDVFPNLKPWQAKSVFRGSMDTPEARTEALDAFLMKHLGRYIHTLTPEEAYALGIRRVVSRKEIEKFGLRGVLARHDNQPYKLFAAHYPRQILPWSVERRNQFEKEDPQVYARRALKWLFEEYFELLPEELPTFLTNALFWQVGFSGLMTSRAVGLNSSTFAAADLVYPGQFTPKDFSRRRGRDGNIDYSLLYDTPDMRKWRWKEK